MVERKWVGAMFLKMPPESGIPNLKEADYRAIMEEVKQHQKEILQQHEISFKKLNSPIGD